MTKTYIGRKDATAPAPAGQLPAANVSAAEAKFHFAAAGFSSQDLAALIGSHSASRQFNTDLTKVGATQDLTPGIWVCGIPCHYFLLPQILRTGNLDYEILL